MSLATYDQIAPRLLAVLNSQLAFHPHGVYAFDNGGVVVYEVWDSRDQHQAWFDGHVRPNIPPDAQPQIEYAELHNLATP